LNILNAESSTDKFFEYWTLKESYIKFVGVGLSMPLNEFCIEFLRDEIRVADVYLKQYELGAGYKMAVCAGHKDFPDEFSTYAIPDIVKKIIKPSFSL
jgi:4'-phosphopantetheinyl transferase